MGFLDLIKKGVAINANPEKETTRRTSKEKNPIFSELRIYWDGSIYPSAKAVETWNLEYPSSTAAVKGNGFDVIDSRKFTNTAASTTPFLMITAIPKNEAKIDIFGSCRYDGIAPMSSVMTQGSNTFGETLLTMLKEVYGTVVEKGDYVDLDIIVDNELAESLATSTNNIYHIPKTISRGPDKGTQSYTRRENLTMNILIPHVLNTTADMASGTSMTEKNETITEKVN
jgi:hypothetical protein